MNRKLYRGCRHSHVRASWRNTNGQRRTFAARWRARQRVWECCIQGYGMKARRWHSPTQHSAMTTARLADVNWSAAWSFVFEPRSYFSPWDGGIEQAPRIARGDTEPIPFFLLAPLPDYIVPGSVRPWVPFVEGGRVCKS